ncbi:hypothetical protein ACNPQM_15240 [Streptomyces sp. NPDC056231]|uniref:hypothetical protein n=1 Tax=Streptomyces sp. NPDC056231 TaxID=3345755 RepID=UPI003AAD544B
MARQFPWFLVAPARQIRKVRAECLTAWAQLMEALVAERRPDRPVPLVAGTAAIGAAVHLPATAIEEGRDRSSMGGILVGIAAGQPLACAAGLTARPHFRCRS